MSELYMLFRRHPHDPRQDSGHVTVQVFVGHQPGSRGNAGDIVLRNEEWEELSRNAYWSSSIRNLTIEVRGE